LAKKPTLSAYKPSLRERAAIIGEKGFKVITGREPGYEARENINRYTGLLDMLELPGMALSADDARRNIQSKQYGSAAGDIAGLAMGAIPIAGGALKGGAKKAVKEGVEAATRLAAKYELPPVITGAEREANLARFMEGNHPLVPNTLYHGTDRDISNLELDKTRRIDGGMGAENYDTGWFGKGHYLTSRPRSASWYAGEGEGANVLPLHPSLKNPFIVEGIGGMDMDRAISMQYPDAPPVPQQGRLPSVQTAFLKSKGHDGVIAVDPEGYNEFVAFDGKQLKSKFNIGTFNPEEPHLSKARGGLVRKYGC